MIDTGATSVVLTWRREAIGLPIEMLDTTSDVETAGGHTRRAADARSPRVGQLVEKSIPALVGATRADGRPQLLGMSLSGPAGKLGLQAYQGLLHGYPDVAGRSKRRAAANRPA